MSLRGVESVNKESETAILFMGLWRNQHGSEVFIASVEDSRISGTFKTGVGAHDPDEVFDLTGFVTDDLIGFSVNFAKHGCLTSWSGQHTSQNGIEKIVTMWHLARAIPDSLEKLSLWAGIWTGADTFVRHEKDGKRDLDLFDRPTLAPSYPFRISQK